MTRNRPSRDFKFALLVICLVAVAAGLGALLVILLDAAAGADEKVQKALIRLAGFALALLGLILVALFWAILRQVVSMTRRRYERKPSEYMDLWAEAGRRLKVDGAEAEGEQGGDASGNPGQED